ncbi:MAG: aminopeptidase [Desulfomonile tiedjei]|uniref:M18 family aminopeptidase n=1 Tax=Desulfomonile tiedjei TaxID=2358 RepID=A0A9D6Z649_9BACT|nr:aminopeptidase [Desulfomonile tiedjei]
MPPKKEKPKQLGNAKELKEKLYKEPVRTWDTLSENERKQAFDYAERFRIFLNAARTERKAIQVFVDRASKEKFKELSVRSKGSKFFQSMHGKTLAVAVIGRKPLTEGLRIITAHVDCPRLDLKANPLYEDSGMAFLKTHYYGGVKKYQWVARSLALCGTIIRGDGSVLDVHVGLDPDDPVFTIPDLLPHLARKQMDQKASDFIPAENLNLVVGSTPFHDKDADERVKLALLELLNKKYDITEEDFTSAELQVVPAEPARDAGFDRGLIAGYGQDDRVCAYTCFTAAMETENPEHTAIAVFYDKEEIGSEGNTSAKSRFLETFIMDLMEKTGTQPKARDLYRVFMNSKALSADVAAGLDPTYADVYEKRNSARLGYGINITKYTGHGGKYMASDANAEYAAWIRKLFNDNAIVWQAGGHGKIDEGGGGTVAKFLAVTGVDIIDCGPPVLSMHSPMEISSKEDIWMCHKAFKVFFNS